MSVRDPSELQPSTVVVEENVEENETSHRRSTAHREQAVTMDHQKEYPLTSHRGWLPWDYAGER
jgi:hypothetical protein